MKLGKLFITAFFAIISTFMFSSCSKDEEETNPFENLASRCEGEYHLAGIYWGGEPLDLNKDGVSHSYDLWHEMVGIQNYSESKNIVMVINEKTKEHSYIRVCANLPYPNYIKKDKDIIFSGIEYIEQEFSIRNESEYLCPRNNCRNVLNISKSDNYFLANVSEIYLEEFNEHGLTIKAHCKIYISSNDEMSDADLIYFFDKQKRN